MDEKERLLSQLDRLHTTPLGAQRIARSLGLQGVDVVEYCKGKLLAPSCCLCRRGKNWYCRSGGVELTINAGSCTIITAHFVKE